MSDYTITLYELEKNGFFEKHPLDYPIFAEEYRETLNNTILSHYRFREIGFINPVLWIERLNARLSRIMEDKYNILFKLKKTEFNPLYNIELKEEFSHEIVNNAISQSTSNNKSDNSSLSYSGEYPNEEMLKEEIGSSLYADSSSHSKDKNTEETITQGNENNNMIENYTKTTQGSSAGLSFAHALLQAKQFADKYDLLNQIIKNISDLFIQVW